jgi:glycerol-3-phosphate dehydrogenase (NAD(P)+)
MQDAARGIHQVVEGVFAARAVCAVAERLDVEMPICREIFRVMHEDKPVREAAQELMGRDLRAERD